MSSAIVAKSIRMHTRCVCLILVVGLSVIGADACAQVRVQGSVRADVSGPQVSRHVFGQFSEHLGTGIYSGIWVGPESKIANTHGYRNDVLAALKALDIPNIRWPGGCFADEYHWRDGIGPREQRAVGINTTWGGVEETNAFGTHEFMEFTEMLGAEAYVAGNLGSAGPEEMAQWVEYLTSATDSTLARQRRANGREQPWQLPYFGVGNELWGCGGNMRPEYAADLYRRYQTFVKVPAGQKLFKIAPGANVDDYQMTEVMMRQAGKYMDGLSLHYYTIPGGWSPRAPSQHFTEDAWIETLSRALQIDTLIQKHSAIMDKYDPDKRVALVVDEWGTWYAPLPGTNPGFLQQQNTLRDALVAALSFDVFTAHAERVRMANIAQMVNVLQAMILTDEARMLLTPTYHVFMLYKPYQDATALPLQLDAPVYEHAGYRVPSVHGSAVRGADGQVYLALTNLHPANAAEVSVAISGMRVNHVGGQILTAPAVDSFNDHARPETVVPAPFAGARVEGSMLRVALPAKSVVMLQLE
jgi:alpha-N-arabinofuranosidase